MRELTSSAIVRTRSIGWRVNSATESTAPSDAIDDVRHDGVVVGVARVLDDRHQPEVDLAGLDEIGAARRHVEAQRDVGPGVEALDQRPRVEIADGAEADDRDPAATPS